ncbi:amidohydrolase [Streptomyces umbrinus]|uniref:amidohydrolase n=1 Tax=Streptomyces umbrinus TaxID=67370 RepID=UPI003418D073
MSTRPSRRRLLASTAAVAGVSALAVGPAATSEATTRRRSAALVIHNARVWTGSRRTDIDEAIAVGRDGTVLATGPSGVVRRFAGRDTQTVDARGATVMSGFIDGHAHPTGAGSRSLNPSLHHATHTVAELQETLRGFLSASTDQEPDGWLVVEEWNTVGLPAGTQPHHRILDALPTRRPIALIGGDGHNTWANQRALGLAGITARTPNPAGGEIVHDADGEPTGLLKDDAAHLVRRLIPEPDEAALLDACAKALAGAAARGVTTFMDARVDAARLDIYAGLARSGRLPQRIVPALWLDTDLVKDPRTALDHLRALREKYRGVPGLRFGTAKVFLDGVIEHPAQTAALLEPYLGDDGKPTGERGDLYADSAELGALTTVLDRAGWQLHTHAIGDRAVRTALDGYELAMRTEGGRRGSRHSIAHLELVHPDDYARFARLGVVACMQLQWAVRNEWTMRSLLPYIGADRHRRLYPARSLQRHGATLSGGSDWPVDPLSPLNQIRTAVDRHGEAGEDSLHPELESISRTASLRMHTAASSYQLRLEHLTGTLTPGKAADLVLLDRDITRGPVKEISEAKVRLTLAAGTPVHDADAGTAT